MKKAFLLKDNLKGFNGHAAVYRLSEPLDGNEFVVVSAVDFDNILRVHETFIFASTRDGFVETYTELTGSLRDTTSHAKTLAWAGYEIAEQAA